jgi:hypothetical protein
VHRSFGQQQRRRAHIATPASRASAHRAIRSETAAASAASTAAGAERATPTAKIVFVFMGSGIHVVLLV